MSFLSPIVDAITSAVDSVADYLVVLDPAVADVERFNFESFIDTESARIEQELDDNYWNLEA